MHRNTAFFWIVIALPGSASLFSGAKAARQMRAIHHSGGKLRSGNVLRFDSAMDGDTILVAPSSIATGMLNAACMTWCPSWL